MRRNIKIIIAGETNYEYEWQYAIMDIVWNSAHIMPSLQFYFTLLSQEYVCMATLFGLWMSFLF